jgi:2-dehydropantoate 2-reductase
VKIGVLGAGAVGGYLGARLSAGGSPVMLVGRAGRAAAPAEIRAIDLDGQTYHPGADMIVTADPGELREVAVCLLAVKSQDNGAAVRALAPVLRPDALVVCFQNGIGNAAGLRDAGLGRAAVDAIVTFNIVREGAATFRQTTSGSLLVGSAPGHEGVIRGLRQAFSRAGVPLARRPDIAAVAAGKLLINLGNGLSAVTGLPTAAALRSPAFRRCFSACITEGRRVFAAAGMPVAAVDRLPPALVARLMRLPEAIFLRLAPRLVRVDPEARSSTLQDLDRRRITEIDQLNGAIVALAARHGVAAPCNRWVTEQVHRLEASPGSHLSPEAVEAAFAAL